MTDLECLHCGQTAGEVKENQTFCATVDYYGECQDEWPKHRWKDWSDKTLTDIGILPEHFDKYRRFNVADFQFIDCAHRGREHTTMQDDDIAPDWLCVACWADTRDKEAGNA